MLQGDANTAFPFTLEVNVFEMSKWEWRMGVHSGFPNCCIVYYLIRKWMRVPRLLGIGWINVLWSKTRAKGVNYIRCPFCAVRGRTVDMHRCYPGCGGPRDA